MGAGSMAAASADPTSRCRLVPAPVRARTDDERHECRDSNRSPHDAGVPTKHVSPPFGERPQNVRAQYRSARLARLPPLQGSLGAPRLPDAYRHLPQIPPPSSHRALAISPERRILALLPRVGRSSSATRPLNGAPGPRVPLSATRPLVGCPAGLRAEGGGGPFELVLAHVDEVTERAASVANSR
jgi:hypothetical protein